MEGDSFFQITSISGNDYTLNRDVNYLPDDAEVFMVTPVRLTVIGSTLYLQNFVYSTNSNKLGLWEVAENIENMQLEFNADGDQVTVHLLARTTRPDSEHVDTAVYRLGSELVGPFNDHYHRIVSRGTVRIRSMS